MPPEVSCQATNSGQPQPQPNSKKISGKTGSLCIRNSKRAPQSTAPSNQPRPSSTATKVLKNIPEQCESLRAEKKNIPPTYRVIKPSRAHARLHLNSTKEMPKRRGSLCTELETYPPLYRAKHLHPAPNHNEKSSKCTPKKHEYIVRNLNRPLMPYNRTRKLSKTRESLYTEPEHVSQHTTPVKPRPCPIATA